MEEHHLLHSISNIVIKVENECITSSTDYTIYCVGDINGEDTIALMIVSMQHWPDRVCSLGNDRKIQNISYQM